MAKIEVNTPAKINIGLYVTGKRQDGYHNIETIFYPVNIYDQVTIEDSDQFSFTTNDDSLPSDSSNLAVYAKNLLEEYTGEKLNVRIHLDKKIPVGAGLGGGSSDAAAVLNSLNKFAGLNLTINEIFDLALTLGSDVPFFLNPRPSFACGRGEVLEPLLLNSELPIVIVNPGINVSTKWAYSKITPREHDFDLKKIAALDFYHLKLYNDKVKNVFEEIVFESYPLIKELRYLHFKLGAVFSMMSGSGSTVFGIYPDYETALSAGKLMREQGYKVFIHDEEKSR